MHTRALLAIFLLGCPGPSENDGGSPLPDRGDPPMCDAPLAFEPGAAEGVSDPLGSGAGEVRAGRVAAADLPVDPDGLARWRDRDFVLANDRVAVVISDLGPGELYDPYGGRIVGLAQVEGGALVDPADYNLALLATSRYIVATETVGVIADGSDGVATIRAAGPLTAIRALADLLDTFLADDLEGMQAAIDYELAADSDALDVYLSVRTDTRPVRARLGSVQVFFQGFRMPSWAPVTGFGDRSGTPPYIAFEDPRATSYAWTTEAGTVTPLFGTGGFDVLASGRFFVDPCSEGRLHLGRMFLGGPGLPGVQARIAEANGEARTTISGSVREADGSAATGVRVHVTSADGEHLTRFFTESDGTFTANVASSAAQLWAWREGEPIVGPIAIGGDNTITMAAFGTIEVTATDPMGAPLPVRVEITPLDAPAPGAPPEFGEPTPGDGRSHVAFPTDGVASFRVPPGNHRVTVTRGPEYERFEVSSLAVAAGETQSVDASLTRVVDTTGVMCADYHIHTHRSVDSSDDGRLKVAGLVADGLEIPIRSEHEWVSDFAPVIAELGLNDWAFGMAGLELTTFTYGHFGVFPLEPDPERASGGAIRWYDRLAPDVFDEVRARPEMPGLIINHPRAGGIRQGYFNEAGFDPATGMVARPELWDEDFTVVELFNESSFEENREGTVRDWFSLLNSGRRVFAVGSSDSHRIYGVPVGYPRTCLRVGVDDPSGLTTDLVRDATMQGRSIVSGGIYLEITGDAEPGGEATGVTRASFDVVVRAAEWVDVDRLEVIVDGITTEMVPITDPDPLEPTIRARATIEADVAAGGSWIVFHASGGDPLNSHGDLPFAVSNPIFMSR